MTVSGRPNDRLGANVAAGTRPILDDEGLTKPLRQPLSHQARKDIGGAAAGKLTDNNAHRASWVCSGDGPSWVDGRNRGNDCQTQKMTARNLHGAHLWVLTPEPTCNLFRIVLPILLCFADIANWNEADDALGRADQTPA